MIVQEAPGRTLARPDTYHRHREIVRAAKTFIVESRKDSLSLRTVSRELQVGTAHLSRIFKAVEGEGIASFIAKLKLAQAKALLENQRLTVKEVAYQSGFVSPEHFSRWFKKQTGIPPTTFRATIVMPSQ